jgi:hypothetical protein
MSKGNNVRLTPEAHQLLAEKAEDYNVSMKDVASEAIVLLTKREEWRAHVERLEQKSKDNKLFALGTFVLGALASGCVMFFVGVL